MLIDSTKIDDIIGNLIDNAIHYTAKGSITVSLDIQDTMMKISVKDTGMGFSPKDKKKFFQKFSRTKEALKANPNGTGMGIYVVKLLTEQMNGRVEATSPGRGQGSEFSVYLPLA